MFKKVSGNKASSFGVKINADNKIVAMEFNMSYSNLVEYVNNCYDFL